MPTLEDTLKSLARRILAMDEDELVRLIPKYRKRMDNFTPTQEWEESVIIYFIINGYRVKSAQFVEELKGYMSRKRKDVDWAPPVKPDIRQVLANLTVKAPSPPDGSATGDEEPPGAPKRRPALRLVRPKKER